MNFSEFQERIGAEPRSNDPELQAARRSGEEFEQAALEAEALEKKIEDTLNFGVNSDEVLGRVLAIPAIDQRPRFSWMARAASVLVLVGLASMVWYQSNQPSTVEEYVSHHFNHDGAKVIAGADGDFDPAQVNRVLANFKTSASPELVGQVGYIKVCPTLHGKGAHMVLSSGDGPVTVIYMPDTEVAGTTIVRFDNMSAQFVTLEHGSAAIIAPQDQSVEGIKTLLRDAMRPGTVDA